MTDDDDFMRWVGALRRSDLVSPDAVKGLDSVSAYVRKRWFALLAERLPTENSVVRDFVPPEDIVRMIREAAD